MKSRRHQLNIISEEILKPHDVTNPLHASKKLWQSNISREKLLTTIDRMIVKVGRCVFDVCCGVFVAACSMFRAQIAWVLAPFVWGLSMGLGSCRRSLKYMYIITQLQPNRQSNNHSKPAVYIIFCGIVDSELSFVDIL